MGSRLKAIFLLYLVDKPELLFRMKLSDPDYRTNKAPIQQFAKVLCRIILVFFIFYFSITPHVPGSFLPNPT